MPDSLLIADIGGSSSRWAWCAADGRVQVISGDERTGPLQGFNPATGDEAGFRSAIQLAMKAQAPEALAAGRVVVYGAGCGAEMRRERMRELIASMFPDAALDVESDLLGAARALWGGDPGLVVILGTGMNAGWYDGTVLDRAMASLGYLLGDEGSGADLGRHLLNALHYGRLSQEVVGKLFPEGAPDLASTIESVYRSGSPAKVLASHAKRLASAKALPEVAALVNGRFEILAGILSQAFDPPLRGDVRATGSIAWAFREELASALGVHGMRLTAVEQDPLPGLVKYHRPAMR